MARRGKMEKIDELACKLELINSYNKQYFRQLYYMNIAGLKADKVLIDSCWYPLRTLRIDGKKKLWVSTKFYETFYEKVLR